jgi:hypothetical protein
MYVPIETDLAFISASQPALSGAGMSHAFGSLAPTSAADGEKLDNIVLDEETEKEYVCYFSFPYSTAFVSAHAAICVVIQNSLLLAGILTFPPIFTTEIDSTEANSGYLDPFSRLVAAFRGLSHHHVVYGGSRCI